MTRVSCIGAIVLDTVDQILQWSTNKLDIQSGMGDEMINANELIFTGQIYIYSERPVPQEQKDMFKALSRTRGRRLTFRSVDYMNERNRWEKPKAFVAHDHRDKNEIAEPLAVQLQKFMCPVWYDEFSLRVGDSLRESIEKGLKESNKCIIILTPNFLSNGGWAKREYDSIFTRELIERRNVILPVWHNVTAHDIYQYSPVLADRKGIAWSGGVETVARQLLQAIDGGT